MPFLPAISIPDVFASRIRGIVSSHATPREASFILLRVRGRAVRLHGKPPRGADRMRNRNIFDGGRNAWPLTTVTSSSKLPFFAFPRLVVETWRRAIHAALGRSFRRLAPSIGSTESRWKVVSNLSREPQTTNRNLRGRFIVGEEGRESARRGAARRRVIEREP